MFAAKNDELLLGQSDPPSGSSALPPHASFFRWRPSLRILSGGGETAASRASLSAGLERCEMARLSMPPSPLAMHLPAACFSCKFPAVKNVTMNGQSVSPGLKFPRSASKMFC